jgi:hypothetical protein
LNRYREPEIMAQERLKRSELEILQKEEEALKEIIAKYEDGLNKLKVEELTIRSELGRAQDKDLHSRNNTPISTGNLSRPASANTVSPVTSSQSLQMFRSLSDREALEISVQSSTTDSPISSNVTTTTANATVNQSTLNLGTALIHMPRRAQGFQHSLGSGHPFMCREWLAIHSSYCLCDVRLRQETDATSGTRSTRNLGNINKICYNSTTFIHTSIHKQQKYTF